MKSLDQIRAAHALKFWRDKDGNPPQGWNAEQGDAVNKLPALIRNGGLLSAVAFAIEKKKNHLILMETVIGFLVSAERGLLPPLPQARPGEELPARFIRMITEGENGTSHSLQIATAEGLRYLEFLKRFAP